MNIHVFVNDGQRELLEKFFRPSLKDAWTIVEHPVKVAEAQNFMTRDYLDLVTQKVETLVSHIFSGEAENEFAIVSDIDIQFFQLCEPTVRAAMVNRDIVFQSEAGTQKPLVNAGFYCFRPTESVRLFWASVLAIMRARRANGLLVQEQETANELLAASGLRWGQFPDTIAAFSNSNINWHGPGIRKVLMHHANCTYPSQGKSSLELKIEQLQNIATLYKKEAALHEVDELVDLIAQAAIDRIEERDKISSLADTVAARVFALRREEGQLT